MYRKALVSVVKYNIDAGGCNSVIPSFLPMRAERKFLREKTLSFAPRLCACIWD